MRITSQMIMKNASSNINYNKTLLDAGEKQMTTQTKISRPSDDPVIAVRSLALQTRLSKINQYYGTNIPEAEEWMSVTETALENIITSITDLKQYCNQGSTGTLTESDKNTILKQLKSLQQSIFAEGNADYAGRTVFTGYRTDKTLVFTSEDSDKKYNITQNLSASDFEKVTYFKNSVQVPANKNEIEAINTANNLTKDEITIESASYKRLRLAYDRASDIESLTFSHQDADGKTVKNTMQLVLEDKDRIPQLAQADDQGNLVYGAGVVSKDTRQVKSADGSIKPVPYTYYTVGVTDGTNAKTVDIAADAQGNRTRTTRTKGTDADGNALETEITVLETNGIVTSTKKINTITKADGSKEFTTFTTDVNGAPTVTSTPNGIMVPDANANELPKTVYVFENELDWADWSGKQPNGGGVKYVPNDAAVLIKETGDLIFGKSASDQMTAKSTSVSVNYDKNSFSAGELKPEYYFDCVDNTGVNYKDLDGTIGSRLVYNRSDIAYDINYTVAMNQTLTVNIQANEVFDSSVQQDMNDLTQVITSAINAYEKREKISGMMKSSEYQDAATQEKLAIWYTAASREYDYYKDYMQETFERVLGNTDTYLNKANLGETTLSCRGDELQITKKRMDQQQESVTELKNKNDNLDLSTIMMNYTAYYTAYQASLVAAGKLGQQSLLNYI